MQGLRASACFFYIDVLIIMEAESSKNRIEVEAGNWLLLQDAAKWARWLAIAGYLFLIGLIYLGLRSVYTLVVLQVKEETVRDLAATTSIASLLGVLFLYFPFRWLYRFGFHLKRMTGQENSTSLTISLLCLRSFFRYLTIWTFLVIGLYAIFVLFTGIASMLGWGAQ
jgi:hypothetical protein